MTNEEGSSNHLREMPFSSCSKVIILHLFTLCAFVRDVDENECALCFAVLGGARPIRTPSLASGADGLQDLTKKGEALNTCSLIWGPIRKSNHLK